MEVFKKHGTKERLFEMMKNVNKGLIKEDFDYNAAEKEHLGQQDLAADQAQHPEDHNNLPPANEPAAPVKENQAQFELDLATKMYNGLLSDKAYMPTNDLDRLALNRMLQDRLVDYDSEEGDDYFWLTNEGVAEIKSPQDIVDGYMYMQGGGNDSESPYLRGYEPES